MSGAVPERAEVIASIAAYSTCSISMILLNKLVMDTYRINYPMGLLFIQNFFAVVLVMIGKQLGLLYYPDFDMKVVKRWMPLTLLFVAMLWTSMKSLFTMSVAVQTILKNLAIILTALGDVHFFHKDLPKAAFIAFGLMVLGSYLGSASDKWVTPWGLFWTFANVITTVSYVLYMKLLLGEVSQHIGRYGPVFYNNLLSLPFILPAAVMSSSAMANDISEAPSGGLFCLLLMTLIGGFVTFASFWCMKVTSPTTYSVCGALNKVPLAVLGIFIFGTHPTMIGYVGIFCALSAGVLYAWVVRPRPKAEEKMEEGESGGPPTPLTNAQRLV